MLEAIDLREGSRLYAWTHPHGLGRDGADECETGCENRCETLFSFPLTQGLS